MKTSSGKLWFKLSAITLVIAIIILLLIPSELTNRQFVQIKPGMSIEKVIDLLGKPSESLGGEQAIVARPSGNWTNHIKEFNQSWCVSGKWWKPSMSAIIPANEIDFFYAEETSTWIGKTHLFVVEHKDGIVVNPWLYPITRTGGGIQGCVDSIKKIWNNWIRR